MKYLWFSTKVLKTIVALQFQFVFLFSSSNPSLSLGSTKFVYYIRCYRVIHNFWTTYRTWKRFTHNNCWQALVAKRTSVGCRWSCDRICVAKCSVCDGKISKEWNLSGLLSFVFIFPCSLFICKNSLGSCISRAFTGGLIAILESSGTKAIWIIYTHRCICKNVNNWRRGKELWAQSTDHLFE